MEGHAMDGEYCCKYWHFSVLLSIVMWWYNVRCEVWGGSTSPYQPVILIVPTIWGSCWANTVWGWSCNWSHSLLLWHVQPALHCKVFILNNELGCLGIKMLPATKLAGLGNLNQGLKGFQSQFVLSFSVEHPGGGDMVMVHCISMEMF